MKNLYSIFIIFLLNVLGATSLHAQNDGVYLVGYFNDWMPNENYQFEANPEKDGEYIFTTNVKAGWIYKVVKVEDGNSAWYPGESNLYFKKSGEVNIYFNSTYNSSWSEYGGNIWIEYTSTESIDDGFYLIGNWTNWGISSDYKLTQNPEKEGEYMITMDVSSHHNYFALKVENNAVTARYPEIQELFFRQTGQATIYFSETYNQDWQENGGYFWIEYTFNLEDGFYLVNGYDSWTPQKDYKFVKSGNEYKLETYLKNGPLKVVKIANKKITSWYPEDGDGFQMKSAANGTVYFSEVYKEEWSAFGGYFYIESELEFEQAALCGFFNDWSTSKNLMTEVSPGIYSAKYVAPESYQAINISLDEWTKCFGGTFTNFGEPFAAKIQSYDNIYFSVDSKSVITVTLDLTNFNNTTTEGGYITIDKTAYIIPTAISDIDDNEETNGTWYNVSGQALGTKPVKAGIYIRNGKKVIIQE
ncbi:MAG: hypothetical protein K5893_01025 [Prevotella sp.]|nr:hypothetical protein [Prevotella sp.]